LRHAYVVLLALAAVDAAGYSVIAPTLPSIADSTGAGPALAGALVASFSAGLVLGFALGGRGVERRSTRTVIAAGLVLVVLGALGFVLGDELAAYFAGRFVMGVGSGCLWIGIAFATLEGWPHDAYRTMSAVLAAYAVGALIGPGFGSLGGVVVPFLAYLALAAAMLPASSLLRRAAAAPSFGSERDVLRLPSFWIAAAGILAAYLALGVLDGTLPLHFASQLSQAEIGGLYVGTAVVVAASTAAAGRLPMRPLLPAGALAVVVGIAVAGATAAVHLWLVALLVTAIGIGLSQTASTGILLADVEAGRMVLAMVVWSQLAIVGYLLGPLAGGAIATWLGFAWLGLVPLAAVGALAAAYAWSRSR
jgi:MFS family permease